MSFTLLNIGMLIGMLGIAVPVIVHFLNRRRFDVVQWGAMRFLDLGERTRQRIKLSDLLLLLLRMAMVALLAFTFSRPFVQGNSWVRGFHPEPVDLVIVIDGSYSMGWTGENLTPHARAIQSAHEILDGLTSVDRVAIIDARQRPHLLTPAPLTDPATARLELEKIQRPDGPANLVQALNLATGLLTQSYSTRRDAIVLTDKQKLSWDLDDKNSWSEMLKTRRAAAVPINISAIDVGTQNIQFTENFLVEKLEASRELLVVDSPVTVNTRIKYSGKLEETTCEVFWSVDGQQLSRETETIRLRNGEEAAVQFTTRFTESGPHIISASVQNDTLPGDDQSQISLQVLNNIPVLIVTNQKQPPKPNQSVAHAADFFLKLGFGDSDTDKVWVNSKIISYEQLEDQDLKQTRLIFFIATNELAIDNKEKSKNDSLWENLTDFLLQGGTVVFLPDGKIKQDELSKIALQWKKQDQQILPALFGKRVKLTGDEQNLDLTTFSANWLQRFRESKTTDLADVLVSEFWSLTLPEKPKKDNAPNNSGKNNTKSKTKDETANQESELISAISVDARLQSNAILFTRRFVGRGQVLVSAISFDGIGNDLVRKRSYVPFLHELVMGLSQTASSRNVELSQPLIVRSLPCQPLKIKVSGPDDSPLFAERAGSTNLIQWKLPPPRLSGIYRFEPGCEVLNHTKKLIPLEIPFSVHAPRGESNLDRLEEIQIEELNQSYQIAWQPNAKQMLASIASASGGVEIWPLLLLLFIVMLVIELLMTRRLVQGGHHQIETPVSIPVLSSTK